MYISRLSVVYFINSSSKRPHRRRGQGPHRQERLEGHGQGRVRAGVPETRREIQGVAEKNGGPAKQAARRRREEGEGEGVREGIRPRRADDI